MEKIWRFLKKLKIELPYYPAILHLGIYPKEMKTGFQRDIFIPMQYYSQQPRYENNLSVHQQMNKEDMIYYMYRYYI